jgi:hypothetical protein
MFLREVDYNYFLGLKLIIQQHQHLVSEYGFTSFLDDDNVILPDYVEKMINNCLKHNQKISVCQIILNNEYVENEIIPKSDVIKFGEIDSPALKFKFKLL